MGTLFKKKSNREGAFQINSKAGKILFAVVFVIFLIQSLSLIYPVFWMIISSLKVKKEYLIGNSFAFPQEAQWHNYVDAFTMLSTDTQNGPVNFMGMLGNSIWYVAIMTFLSVFIPSITGYVISKYRFKGRALLYTVVITTMMIPFVGTSAAYMKFVVNLGIYDSPLFAVYNGLGAGFGGSFLVYYGFFKSVSWSYAEAVQIDGGGPYTIFFRVMLPQAMPVLLTYAITNGIVYWNEYETILLYMPSLPTLAAGLFGYKTQMDNYGNFPLYFAGLIISMAPTLVVFAIFSNRIMGSISIGGLKG